MSKNEELQALQARIAELEQQLEAAKTQPKKSHRKYEVLRLLQEGPKDTSELAVLLNTTKNNIGSLLTYLRKQDKILIYRDNKGRHFIPAQPIE